MWQADHTPLDVMLLDEEGKPAKPYLTAIEDDFSRLIVGYRLSFQTATALTTALTLRQAIWHYQGKSAFDRLMLQVEHVLLANKLQVVTKEVVETARQNLIIGPG